MEFVFVPSCATYSPSEWLQVECMNPSLSKHLYVANPSVNIVDPGSTCFLIIGKSTSLEQLGTTSMRHF